MALTYCPLCFPKKWAEKSDAAVGYLISFAQTILHAPSATSALLPMRRPALFFVVARKGMRMLDATAMPIPSDVASGCPKPQSPGQPVPESRFQLSLAPPWKIPPVLCSSVP